MTSKPKMLQLRLTFSPSSPSFVEFQAANDDTRAMRIRHYELIDRGREFETLIHAGLYSLPQVQQLLQTIGARSPRVPRAGIPGLQVHEAVLDTSIPISQSGRQPSPAVAAEAIDTESNGEEFSMIDASQWMPKKK